jgi:hypothetical protein
VESPNIDNVSGRFNGLGGPARGQLSDTGGHGTAACARSHFHVQAHRMRSTQGTNCCTLVLKVTACLHDYFQSSRSAQQRPEQGEEPRNNVDCEHEL